jgi:Na+-driven multidrug efflux pump
LKIFLFVFVCRRLMKLAGPLALQSIASMMTTFISTTFVGHLNDPLALSAVVLSSSLFNVTGISITIGLASAMDTLCGQVRECAALHCCCCWMSIYSSIRVGEDAV